MQLVGELARCVERAEVHDPDAEAREREERHRMPGRVRQQQGDRVARREEADETGGQPRREVAERRETGAAALVFEAVATGPAFRGVVEQGRERAGLDQVIGRAPVAP